MDNTHILHIIDYSDSVSDFSLRDSYEYLPSRSEDSASSHDSDLDVPPDKTGDPPSTLVLKYKQLADGSTLNNFRAPPATNCKAVPQSRAPYGYFSLLSLMKYCPTLWRRPIAMPNNTYPRTASEDTADCHNEKTRI